MSICSPSLLASWPSRLRSLDRRIRGLELEVVESALTTALSCDVRESSLVSVAAVDTFSSASLSWNLSNAASTRRRSLYRNKSDNVASGASSKHLLVNKRHRVGWSRQRD